MCNNSNLQISKNMIEKIKKFEGLRLSVYLCPAGVQTIGYGHTRNYPFSTNYRITEEQAEKYLYDDLKKFENSIKKLVKVPLSQCQYDALVSLVFNIGATNLKNSTLLKYLNNGEYSLAAEQFERWIYSNGKKLDGLIARRKAEKLIFLHGKY